MQKSRFFNWKRAWVSIELTRDAFYNIQQVEYCAAEQVLLLEAMWTSLDFSFPRNEKLDETTFVLPKLSRENMHSRTSWILRGREWRSPPLSLQYRSLVPQLREWERGRAKDASGEEVRGEQ